MCTRRAKESLVEHLVHVYGQPVDEHRWTALGQWVNIVREPKAITSMSDIGRSATDSTEGHMKKVILTVLALSLIAAACSTPDGTSVTTPTLSGPTT